MQNSGNDSNKSLKLEENSRLVQCKSTYCTMSISFALIKYFSSYASKNLSVSLSQFSVFNKLGGGSKKFENFAGYYYLFKINIFTSLK